ncbi:MAG: hypothetical protein WCO56_05825 [Verrucomicrobiota bacterium]
MNWLAHQYRQQSPPWISAWVGGSLLVASALPMAAQTTNAPPEPPAPAPVDNLEFLNGDQLKGVFLTHDLKNGVRWQHPAIKQVLTVNPSGISQIRLNHPRTNHPERVNCTLSLANGDELTGSLSAYDDGKFAVETWYAGRLLIPRSAVQTARISANAANTLYEGPTSLDGWLAKSSGAVTVFGGGFGGGQIIINGGVLIQNGRVITANNSRQQGVWQFKDGCFASTGSGATIARQVNLPPTSNIEFDVAFSRYPQFSLYFYSDFLEGFNGNAYILQFAAKNVYLRRQGGGGGGQNFGSIELSSITAKGKARISVRTNREQKTIALLVDDQLVKQWMDTGELGGAGTAILFQSQSAIPIRLSNLRVTEWNGVIDEATTALSNAKEDLVYLANRDKVSGTLSGIKDGKLKFTTQFATLDIPLERIYRIDFNSEKTEKTPPRPTDVRLVFGGRGRLTVQLESWDERQVVGSSPVFGTARFQPSAFSSLQFNLIKPRVDTDSSDTPGGMSGAGDWME